MATSTLPSAFRLARRLPPQVLSMVPGFDGAGNRIVVINGTGFTPETRILFDGVPAVIRSRAGDTVTVLGPATAQGQRAIVVALNADGQSSLFLQAPAPPAVEYDSADLSAISISPSQLPAGVESAIDIQVGGTNLRPEYAALALGSSGVTIRDLWVTGNGRMVANVTVSPSVAPASSTVTVINGVRMATLPFGLQIGVSNPRQSYVRGRVTDPATGRAGIPAGSLAVLQVAGPLAETAATSLRVSVNDQPAVVSSYAGGQLVFRVPASSASGPALVRIASATGDASLPVAMVVDPPPPAIVSAQVSGIKVDSSRPAQPGEVISLTVAGLADPGTEVATGAVFVNVAAILHPAVSIAALNGQHVVQFVLDRSIPAGPQTVSITVDGRTSEPAPLPVRRN
ncbi:MAG: IPT/TIG domain-containing protein [Bryobacteraceae bacterium]